MRHASFCFGVVFIVALLVTAARATEGRFRVLPNLSDPYDLAAIAVSPDKRLVASIGNTLRVWDYERARLVAIIDVEDDPGDAVLFSHDSRYLIYGTSRGQIEVYELETQELVLSFPAHESSVESLELDSTGAILLSSGALDKPTFWRLETGEFLADLDSEDSWPATFLDNDRQVALKTGDGQIAIHSTETGEKLGQISFGETASISTFAVSPDETRVLVYDAGKVSVWDLRTGKKLRDLEAPDNIIDEALAWLPDGRRAVTSGYRKGGDLASAIVWDTETGERLQEPVSPAGAFEGFVIGPEGMTVLSGSEFGPTLFEWPLLNDGPGRIFGVRPASVAAAAFVERQDFVVAASTDRRLRLWGHDGQLRHVIELGLTPHAVAVVPGGKAVAVGGFGEDDVAVLVDLKSRAIVKRYGKASLLGALDLAFSPDGEILYAGLNDGTVRAWRVRDATELAVFGLPNQGIDKSVDAMAIAPSGEVLAVATTKSLSSGRPTIELWNTATGTLIRTLETPIGGADDLVFDSEGKRLLGASGWREVRIWNVETGNLERVIEDVPGNPSAVALQQTGRHLFVGSSSGNIGKFSRPTGRVLAELDGHAAAIDSLSLSADGSRLLSASRDGTVRLWDTNDGRELVNMTAGMEGWLSLIPQGFFTAAGNGGHCCRL